MGDVALAWGYTRASGRTREARCAAGRSQAKCHGLQEWIFIGVISLIAVAAGALETKYFTEAPDATGVSPLNLLLMIVGAVGQGLWITMDRTRRGREVGWWRWGAILLGPLAIWLYLALEYGPRALLLVPVSIAVYAGVLGLAWSVSLLFCPPG